MIHIGDTRQEDRVEIPIFHTGVFGQSGVGKTKLLKYMISQAHKQGYKVLIFDSKIVGPEFEGIGQEIPFYVEESTDPDIFRSLIEGMRTKGRGDMERYRGGFIEVCKGTKDFKEIGANLKAKLEDSKIRGWTRDMYSQIFFDYDKLIKLLGHQKFSPRVQISAPIVRMPTWKLPNLNLQGLVVRSAVGEVLRTQEKLICLVDEAPNFVHQKRFNPAKEGLQDLDGQGRKNELFGWYSGQTLTGFDKANMKNLWYWILGREMERNEAKDVFETQTQKILTIEAIKQLKVREFLVSTPEFTKLVKVPLVDEKELFGEIRREVVEEDWSDVIQRIEKLEPIVR